ncbi:hypothetical protein Hanom_Chr08g00708691 [Helianthus anomalus]
MKMTRFQTFWMQMRKNKPLDESCKTGQTLWTKMTFYSPKKDEMLKLKKMVNLAITLIC